MFLLVTVTRPDGQSEALGLTVLDEPTARQSDPSVLELQLRAISKQSTQKAATVKKIDSGEFGGKRLAVKNIWLKLFCPLRREQQQGH